MTKLQEMRSSMFLVLALATVFLIEPQVVYSFTPPAAGAKFEPLYQLMTGDILNGAVGYSLGVVGLIFTLFYVGTGKIFPAIGAGAATAGLGLAPTIVTSLGALIV